jgi:hypothetical protein
MNFGYAFKYVELFKLMQVSIYLLLKEIGELLGMRLTVVIFPLN